LTLGNHHAVVGLRTSGADLLTVDFLPPAKRRDCARSDSRADSNRDVMNNRRPKHSPGTGQRRLLVARAASSRTGFVSAYNTLGVIYRRHGNPAEAEKVPRVCAGTRAAEHARHVEYGRALNDQGKVAEAETLGKLEQIEPNPVFSYFERGMKAMREGNYKAARDLFAKEVDRAPYYHEFHFWLAAAYLGLGKIDQARKELALAMEYSTTRKDHDLYSAKLDRIKATKLQ
jgi:tetratricopeptide (TPR) repeat protein